MDRNLLLRVLPFFAVVALRKESVDRNKALGLPGWLRVLVALRKESVDRNTEDPMISVNKVRRSPQGERG